MGAGSHSFGREDAAVGDWYLTPDDRWVYDPDAPSAAQQPATTMLPSVPETPHGDVGDWIDPNAPDPTPDEITDPRHPDYVAPWFGP